MSKKLPQTRSKDIVVQNLHGETLIYDIAINKAYCLNETAAIVYNACNESKTFAELTQKHKLTEDLIYFALDELQSQSLLNPTQYVSQFDGMNRREIIKKVGLGSMFALPVISSLVAPTAASAASTCNSCTNSLPLGQLCLIPNGCFSQTGLAGIETTGCATSGTVCRTCTCTIPGGSRSCSSVCA